MQKVSSLVSKSIGDTLTNIRTWGGVMYNVLENGLVGDGTTNDTAALQTLINTAIAAGRKAIFFPHNTYYVTALTNADQVLFFGDNASFTGGYVGIINQLGENSVQTGDDIANIAPSIIKTAIAYNSWPVIVKAPNNDVLCFYNKGTFHGTNDTSRSVVFKRSTDQGYSWGDEVELLNDAYDDAIFSAGVSSVGTIILLIRRSNNTNDISDSTVVMRSTNNGTSWSAPAVVSGFTGTNITLIGPCVDIPTKGLMANYHYGTSGYWESGLFWSSDDGITWGNKQILSSGADSTNIPVECRFVYVGSGKIFGIARNQNDSGLFQLESSDYGVNWSISITNITDQLITPAGIIFQNSYVDIIYVDRENGALRRRKIGIDDVWGNPKRWPNSKLLLNISTIGGDCGYPSAVNINEDMCLGVFYSGKNPNTGIYGIKYSLNDSIVNPFITTKNLTYYVRPDGNDLNDGSANDSAHALKTIQRALYLIPKTILYGHTVTINIDPGTYTEDVVLSDINGAGTLQINGDTAISTSRTLNSFLVMNCNINIFTIRGFNLISTTKPGFFVTVSSNLVASFLNCVTAASQPGFRAISTMATIGNSTFSNRSIGIRNQYGNFVSDTNGGTGNTVGISSETAGTLVKVGTQPGGTTAESTASGGVIRT